MVSSRYKAAGVGTLIGLGAGVVLGLSLAGDRSHVPPDERPRRRPIGNRTDDRLFRGARTQVGAARVARTYALLIASGLLNDRGELTRASQRLAAPTWVEEARRQATIGHTFLTKRYGDDVEVSGAVLRYDVVDFSPQEALVKLWTVSVATGKKRAAVDEVWGTSSVRLLWIHSQWLVAGIDNTTGPAPLDLPSISPSLSAKSVMERFDEFIGS